MVSETVGYKFIEQKDTDGEIKSYGRGKSTGYGYILEWRLKPESVPLIDVLPRGLGQVGKDWSQGPYQIEQLGRLGVDAERLIRPMIEKFDWGRSEHGLVSLKVSKAILACLLTSIPEGLLKNVEWRIVRIRLEKSYELILDNPGSDAEDFQNGIQNILDLYL